MYIPLFYKGQTNTAIALVFNWDLTCYSLVIGKLASSFSNGEGITCKNTQKH